LGGLFYAPVVHYLLNAIGIRKTYHVLAGSQLMIGIILAVFTPPPRPITGQRKFFPRSIWSRAAFYLMIIGGFAYQMVLNQPAIFGPDFTTTLGYTSKFAAIWLAVLNSIGAPTRLILGWVGDQIGRQGTSIFSILITVVSSLGFWMASALLNSRALFWLFTVTYGSMAAGFNQFMGPVLLDIFDSEVFFSVNAAVSFARGVGSLVGSPIGGAILGSREGRRDLPKNYARLAAFTGSLLAVQLVCCCVVWLISRFERLKRLIL
jgi:MFS family permease